MIVAVGIDVVLVERFTAAAAAVRRCSPIACSPSQERMTASGNPRSPESLAARFAAKEAVAKALGAPAGLSWHDCEIVSDPDGRPWLTVSGTVAAAAAERGVTRWHLSLSHDGGIASAMVVAEATMSECPAERRRVADVRAAETALMATLPPGTLMARAAAGLAGRCALTCWPTASAAVYGRTVLLLVGAGDNGGDALYAGALLARPGRASYARCCSIRERAHPDGLAALRGAGGRVVDDVPARVDLVLDGIVGIGGHGPLRPPAAAVVDTLSRVRATDGDPPDDRRGRPAVRCRRGHRRRGPATAVTADVTVTFGCLKPAHVVGAGARLAGLVELVDIGLGPWLRRRPRCGSPSRSDVARWWPVPGPESDKYTRGVVGMATGSSQYTGAALLSVGGRVRRAGRPGPVRRRCRPTWSGPRTRP